MKRLIESLQTLWYRLVWRVAFTVAARRERHEKREAIRRLMYLTAVRDHDMAPDLRKPWEDA